VISLAFLFSSFFPSSLAELASRYRLIPLPFFISYSTMDAVPPLTSEKNNATIYIDWEEDDVEHPLNWSITKKTVISTSLMFFTFVCSGMAAGYYLAYEGFSQEHETSRQVYMLGICFYLLGHAVAPMALAPISESIGRYPVMMVSSAGNLILFLGNIYAKNVTTLIVTRALQGAIGSASFGMSGGFMADMFTPKQRGVVLSFYTLVYLSAGSISPVWASWVAFKMSWQWIFWIQGASCLLSFVLLAIFLREPRPDVLLMKRAKKLTESTGIEHRTKFMDANPTLLQAITRSCTRPFFYLLTEPIVTFYSLWLALVSACSFFMLGAIPVVFEDYSWNMGQRGLPHLGTVCGIFVGFILSITIQERLYRRACRRTKKDKPAPEARLYMAMVGAVLFPLGALLLAFTGRSSVHYMWPVVSIGIIAIGCFPVHTSGYAYLSDAYETYASSALAASSFLKNIVASVVPFFARQVVKKYGTFDTCLTAALIASILGLLPFILMWKVSWQCLLSRRQG
jgi:MFS family permease